LILNSGTKVAAAPVLERHSPPPFRIFWGEGREFEFSTPPGITADDVASSRLVLTGCSWNPGIPMCIGAQILVTALGDRVVKWLALWGGAFRPALCD
jgi:hypothetical protein